MKKFKLKFSDSAVKAITDMFSENNVVEKERLVELTALYEADSKSIRFEISSIELETDGELDQTHYFIDREDLKFRVCVPKTQLSLFTNTVVDYDQGFVFFTIG